MDFTLSETQQMFADMTGRFLRDALPFEQRMRIASSPAGYCPALWRQGAELGVLAALFDEAQGGLGGSGTDISLVFGQVGQALAPQPFLEALVAGRLLAASPAHAALLADLIAGEAVVVPALLEPQARYDLDDIEAHAEPDGPGWRLHGEKAVVRFAAQADWLIVSARAGDETALFLVPRAAPGVEIRDYPLIDGGRGGEVALRDVALNAESRLALDGAALELIERAVAAGLVALCAEAVAIMDVLRDATLEYLRTRTQFGRPIGSFQALQHRMADLATEIEQARSATINAAARLDGERMERDTMVAAAKYTVDRVGTLMAEEAIQLHGGIGMTWELPVSHYAKRLTMIGHQYGDEDHHLDRYIALRRASASINR